MHRCFLMGCNLLLRFVGVMSLGLIVKTKRKIPPIGGINFFYQACVVTSIHGFNGQRTPGFSRIGFGYSTGIGNSGCSKGIGLVVVGF